ncbi:2-hydroxyacyl-CoA dehydratase [candidate division WOR-3 bacterium]|nr:2-hydroxyacyl-CoA dehydratase [candidate division WOR-3 bacterium]
MEGEREMWKAQGIDLKRNDEFLEAAGKIYGDVYMKQPNRPKGMGFFDFVMSEVHSIRPKEMIDHREKGGKVVGTFCVYVPDEIIFAANGIGVGLCCGSDFSFIDAEDILPTNLCPLIKSGMGFKKGMLSPYFEACDFIVGETTCDGKKKVWEIFDNYIPTYIMEVPQKKDPKQRELWLKEVELFKEKMEKESGVTITPEVLGEKIKLINARRKALERLYELRKSSPLPISGKDALLVSQIAFYDDPVRFTSKTNELCDELEERVKNGEGVVEPTAPRILVSGCPMVIPNWKLHHIVETSGAIVACEETCTGTRYFDTPIVDETPTDIDGQLKAIADRYLNIKCSCFTPNDDRIDQIIKFARDYRADGVIYYTLQFCLTYNVEYEKVKRALNKEGIPLLRIETDYSEEDTGQLKTRIEGFLERIS